MLCCCSFGDDDDGDLTVYGKMSAITLVGIASFD
jgi:hypothetical protein